MDGVCPHLPEEWYRDLEDMVANASPDVQNSAQQDWEKHHKQVYLKKSPDCPIFQRESGTRVVHNRKDKSERQS
eukprot:1959142-Amphidinium_carterae.1